MNIRIRIALVLVVVVAAVVLFTMRGGDGGTEGVVASGTVEATDADLGFQVAGRVLRIEVVEGDAVTTGAELARLDTRELEAGLAGARAQLDATEARLAELERGARPQEVVTAEAAVRSASTRAEEARLEQQRAVRSAVRRSTARSRRSRSPPPRASRPKSSSGSCRKVRGRKRFGRSAPRPSRHAPTSPAPKPPSRTQ